MARKPTKKPIRKVWAGNVYEVEVGNGTYLVEARSVAEIMALEEYIRDLVGGDWLTAGGETETEETEPTEQQPMLDFANIKHRIVQAGFAPLKIAIPELTEDDFRAAPLLQLEWVFNLVLEVNGLTLLRSLAKNLLEPLSGAMSRGVRAVLADFLQTTVESAGETPTTES